MQTTSGVAPGSITVIKRDGRRVPYESQKIASALLKAFNEVEQEISEEDLQSLVASIEKQFGQNKTLEVEHIQDIVELALMESEYYSVAKAYILYRDARRKQRNVRSQIVAHIPDIEGLAQTLAEIEEDYPDQQYDLSLLLHKYQSFHKDNSTSLQRLDALIKAAIELCDQEAPKWEFIAGRIYGVAYSNKVRTNWQALLVEKPELFGTITDAHSLSYYDKIVAQSKLGLFDEQILEEYTKEQIDAAAELMVESRDKLLNYSGYDLLTQRYTIRTHDLRPIESVQEMYLGIALFLAIPEENRLEWIKRFYTMLSKLQVTMATPTLSNARKPFHQLSSCFIDTVPDTLKGIYRSISSFANVSKFGGGMGLYFGIVRAQGSPIRGFKGAAGGVIRWIRLANDTAVAVDQLGMRQGAVACYLDVWHKDIPEFLELRTNNGDDRMKAHDVFPAVCYPDYFWEQIENNMEGDWALLCPHEVMKIKGYCLEDYYGDEWKKRYLDCVQDPNIPKRYIPIKELVRLIIKSMVETGTPFTFNRDAVNKANPNKDKGMIYCSNLCTEIAQNMSAASEVSEEIVTEDGDTVIVTKIKPGDFVVCNLASLNLGRIEVTNFDELNEVTSSAIRALDNVIALNFFPVADAKVNNLRYRPIGLGVSGYHHMLATHHISWESQEHLDFVDKVFENINYSAIKASMQNAKEKGAYELFEGSDWQTGEYFSSRNYNSERWQELQADVAKYGMRNGYLLAIAPTASTSIVAGTSPGIDPVMERFYYDEKKNGLIARIAPDLSMDTYWYYKQAHHIDQTWSIKAGGVRTRHIDQATSMNIYITNDYTFRQILGLYLLAWKEGVKTVYYIRSKSLEVEECVSCSA